MQNKMQNENDAIFQASGVIRALFFYRKVVFYYKFIECKFLSKNRKNIEKNGNIC